MVTVALEIARPVVVETVALGMVTELVPKPDDGSRDVRARLRTVEELARKARTVRRRDEREARGGGKEKLTVRTPEGRGGGGAEGRRASLELEGKGAARRDDKVKKRALAKERGGDKYI